MYSIGENFYYEIDGENVEFNILGDMIIKGKEYLVVEDNEHVKSVFIYDDEEESVTLLEDEAATDSLIETWETDFYGESTDDTLWDDEEYDDLGDDEDEDDYMIYDDVEYDDEYSEDDDY